MKNTNVTFRQLRALVQVADSRSFTLAAGMLGLTQSALSVLVRELERELGVRLFDRSSRQVELTAVGREFYPLARRTLNDLREAITSAEDLRDARKGVVRIGAPQMLACTQLPEIIHRFGREHPDAEIHLIDGPLEEHLTAVVAGDIDLAVGPDAQDTEGIEASLLLSDDALLVCAADHPLINKKIVRWADLKQHDFISPSPEFLHRLEANLNPQLPGGLAFRSVRVVSYMTTALGMARTGHGFTLCPLFAASLVEGFGLAMRPVCEPVYTRKAYVYTSFRRSSSPMAVAFIGAMKDFLGQRKAWPSGATRKRIRGAGSACR